MESWGKQIIEKQETMDELQTLIINDALALGHLCVTQSIVMPNDIREDMSVKDMKTFFTVFLVHHNFF